MVSCIWGERGFEYKVFYLFLYHSDDYAFLVSDNNVFREDYGEKCTLSNEYDVFFFRREKQINGLLVTFLGTRCLMIHVFLMELKQLGNFIWF